MLETFLTAFATFFAVIGPVDTAVLLASLTPNLTRAERRAIAVKAVFIATVIILLFVLFGGPVLKQLGVSLAALQTAGGIILFMIALEMILSRRPGAATGKGEQHQRLLGVICSRVPVLEVIPLIGFNFRKPRIHRIGRAARAEQYRHRDNQELHLRGEANAVALENWHRPDHPLE